MPWTSIGTITSVPINTDSYLELNEILHLLSWAHLTLPILAVMEVVKGVGVMLSHREASSSHVLFHLVSFIFLPSPDDQLLNKTIFPCAISFLKRALYQTRKLPRMQLKFWIDFWGIEKREQCRRRRGKSRTGKAILCIGLLILSKQVFHWKGCH